MNLLSSNEISGEFFLNVGGISYLAAVLLTLGSLILATQLQAARHYLPN